MDKEKLKTVSEIICLTVNNETVGFCKELGIVPPFKVEEKS